MPEFIYYIWQPWLQHIDDYCGIIVAKLELFDQTTGQSAKE